MKRRETQPRETERPSLIAEGMSLNEWSSLAFRCGFLYTILYDPEERTCDFRRYDPFTGMDSRLEVN